MINRLSFILTFLLISAFVFAQNDPKFEHVFELDELNTIHITIKTEDWRDTLEYFGQYVGSSILVNSSLLINGKLAKKGNSSNSNTILRDKFPMKFNGPGSFNFKLNNNYRDYTMGAREYLGYKLHKSFTGIGSEVVVADVYVNNEYYGRYNVVEDLNKGFYMDKVGMISERIKSTVTSTGIIKNNISSDLKWLGADPELYEGRYEVKKGQLQTLIDLIDIINNKAEDAHNHIDIEQAIRFIVVENYIMNTDGIIGSVFSHNYELIKREVDGLWQLIPWDLNLCLGAHSESLFNDQELPIDREVRIHPTYGSENNALIRLVAEDYRFLYHHLYNELLWKYPAEKLIGWAKEFKEIIASSEETDAKLYDADLWKKAYTMTEHTEDGHVSGLVPVIQERYNYLKNLNFAGIFYNRVLELDYIGRDVNIRTTPDVKPGQVAIQYFNKDGEKKSLRPTPNDKEANTYSYTLPMDVHSFYIKVVTAGMDFHYPYNGKLGAIKIK